MGRLRTNGDTKAQKRQVLEICTSLVLLTLFQIVFYRKCFHPDFVFGDLGDGRFNNCLCEYWYQFFTRRTGFNDLHSFFPVTDTLAWSDLMIGFGLPYTVLRMIGMDMFTAYKAVMTIFVLAGGYTTWLFLRCLRVSPMGSLLGASIAFCSCSFPMIFGHTQMFFVSFVPLTSISFVGFFRSIDDTEGMTHFEKSWKRRRILFGCFSILGLGLEFWTAYYVAYFHFVTILVVFLVYLIFSRSHLKRQWKRLLRGVREGFIEVLIYIGTAFLWAYPFLMLYLPVLKEFGGREADTVLMYSPRLFDIVMRKAIWIHNFDHNPDEIYVFSTLVFLLLTLVTIYHGVCLYAIRKENDNRQERTQIKRKLKERSFEQRMGMSLAFSVWLLYLMTVRFGEFSFWSVVINRILPGASAIRSISRFISFLILPAGASIALAFDEVVEKRLRGSISRTGKSGLSGFFGWRHRENSRKVWEDRKVSMVRFSAALIYAAELILIILIMAESSFDLYMRWTISSQKKMLDTVKPIPEDCRVFFVCADQDYDYQGYIAMEDAWIIALDSQIYTLNGNSGHSPKGWGLSEPNDDRYEDLVISWVNQYGISDQTYALMMPEGKWVRYKDWIGDEEVLN